MTIKLSNDVSRCHDKDCVERGDCKRWMCRQQGDPNARVVHTESMRPHNLHPGEHCPFRITCG